LPRGGVTEGHVLVERLVLEAGRGLDRRDDLPCHAQLREAAKGRFLVGAEIAYRLVEADQPLLDQVFGIPAGEEVGARLQPDESRIALDQLRQGGVVAVSSLEHELEILELSVGTLSCLDGRRASSRHVSTSRFRVAGKQVSPST